MARPRPLPERFLRKLPLDQPRRPQRAVFDLWTRPTYYRPETDAERRIGRTCIALAILVAVYFGASLARGLA